MPPRRYHYDDALNQAIRTACAGRRGGLIALWRTDPRLRAAGVPYPALKYQARKLGCYRLGTRSPAWTAAEEAYAENAYLLGRHTEVIARGMRQRGWARSAAAIHNRMHQLRIQRRMGDWYTRTDLQALLRVDHHVIQRWITRYRLPVHHRSEGSSIAYIAPGALRRWLLDHIGLVASVATPDLLWYTALLVPEGLGHTLDTATAAADDGTWLNGHAVLDRAAAD